LAHERTIAGPGVRFSWCHDEHVAPEGSSDDWEVVVEPTVVGPAGARAFMRAFYERFPELTDVPEMVRVDVTPEHGREVGPGLASP
jgi:hypothetical protein